jgi:hypothetical protein
MPFSQSDICPLKNDRGEVTGGSGGRTNMGNKAIMNDFSAPQLRLCPLGNKDKAEALYKAFRPTTSIALITH